MNTSQARQLANWHMEPEDEITRIDFFQNGPVVTIRRANGHLATLQWKDDCWCLID